MEEGSSPDSPSDGGGNATEGASGTDGSDARPADGAADSAADGPSEATTRLDSAAETSNADRFTMDVTEEPPTTLNGCIDGGMESCNDGIDNNCDGRIDCSDPQCGGFACAPPVPSGGWFGPALLWTGPFGSAPPSCPGGYRTAVDANQDPTGTADVCSCSCSPSGQGCTASGTFMSRVDCTQQCATVSSIPDGVCTAVPTNTCGTAGSFAAPTPTPSGGTCTPMTTTTPGTPAGWATSARICVQSSAPDLPGGCAGTNQQCVALGGAGFVGTPCIYQPGAATCPAAYPNAHTVYSGEADSRGCAACTCSATPTGGACAGSIALFGSNAGGCAGTPTATFTFGELDCTSGGLGVPYAALALEPGFVQGSFTVTAGTCSVSTPPTPTGSISGIGPTTICCM